ncbi:hypothetical protein QFZ67_002865 [Streptomyces sp. V1I1]|nr:hypothetical protein [Streptomyces sp. V1I1]
MPNGRPGRPEQGGPDELPGSGGPGRSDDPGGPGRSDGPGGPGRSDRPGGPGRSGGNHFGGSAKEVIQADHIGRLCVGGAPPPDPPDPLDRAARGLRRMVAVQWKDEAAHQGLFTTAPLTVRWVPGPGDLADHPENVGARTDSAIQAHLADALIPAAYAPGPRALAVGGAAGSRGGCSASWRTHTGGGAPAARQRVRLPARAPAGGAVPEQLAPCGGEMGHPEGLPRAAAGGRTPLVRTGPPIPRSAGWRPR